VKDTTTVRIEMLPGCFIDVTLPTRYLVWWDDKPKNPEFNPGLRRLLLSGEVKMSTEEPCQHPVN
jgi:hypothetical protein